MFGQVIASLPSIVLIAALVYCIAGLALLGDIRNKLVNLGDLQADIERRRRQEKIAELVVSATGVLLPALAAFLQNRKAARQAETEK